MFVFPFFGPAIGQKTHSWDLLQVFLLTNKQGIVLLSLSAVDWV